MINEFTSWLKTIHQKTKLKNINPLIIKIIHQQAEIGRSHLFRGILTTALKKLSISICNKIKMTNSMQEAGEVVSIIRSQIIISFREHRGKIEHGHAPEQMEIKRKKINQGNKTC